MLRVAHPSSYKLFSLHLENYALVDLFLHLLQKVFYWRIFYDFYIFKILTFLQHVRSKCWRLQKRHSLLWLELRIPYLAYIVGGCGQVSDWYLGEKLLSLLLVSYVHIYVRRKRQRWSSESIIKLLKRLIWYYAN